MPNPRYHTPDTRAAFARWMQNGSTAKEAAAAVGISQKTATAWKKEIPALDLQKQAANVRRLIERETKATAPDASVIARLADAALKLEKAARLALQDPLTA